MDFSLSTHVNEDIPIVVERFEEDAASFIERSFQNMKEQEKVNKQSCNISEDIKSYIENMIKVHLNSKTKRENYYEYELMKSYKERIIFLEEEIKSKNKIIKSLLDTHSAEPSKNLIKNKSDQLNNHTVQNQIQELSFSPAVMNIDTPNTSIIEKEPVPEETRRSLNNQLSEVRKKEHINYLSTKKDIDNQNCMKQNENVLMIGDSMLNGINEIPLSSEKVCTKIKYFSGARIKDITKRLRELLIQKPDIVILHVGTNDAPHMVSNEIVDGLLTLKHKVEEILPTSQVVISSLITRIDNGKANLTIRKVNSHLKQLKIQLLDNSNITHADLGKRGLHLSKDGKRKLEKNVVNKVNILT